MKKLTAVLLIIVFASLSSLAKTAYKHFPETFETAAKIAYATGDVLLPSGVWTFSDALIGNAASDRKNGFKAVRLQHTGKITMKFDLADGASQVIVSHANFGNDASCTWELWYSTNNGTVWTKAGNTVSTFNTFLSTANFHLDINGSVRFEIRKLNGGRLNIDDFTIIDNLPDHPTRDDHLALGNPSNATTDATNPNNYLVVKPQFALSYNNSKGIANWVSWHLSTVWKGSAARCDCFSRDTMLPSGFYRASTSHYTNTGFDRGHICPSDDRDSTDFDNYATFKMTNIFPQAPNCNQRTWRYLEDYCRDLIKEGNELYIISGSHGKGGSGNKGGITYTINNGKITVPAYCWKVIVVLPVGNKDKERINSNTRIIAVNMPNTQTVSNHYWDFYRTNVDAIETLTGYDLLSNIPENIQQVIEAQIDTTSIP